MPRKQITKTGFGKFLRDIRERHDLSQRALASSAGLTPNYLVLLEANRKKPRPSTLARLCQALNASTDERQQLYQALDMELPDTPKVIDPEQLGMLVAEIYYERFTPEERFPDFGRDPFERIAERLRDQSIHFSPQTLREQLRLMEARGKVHHVIDAGKHATMPERDRQLEEKLCERYGLREAVVVDCGTAMHGVVENEQLTAERDDELHRCLGRWAAERFTNLIRATDRVVVGGGRGPYETVHAIGRRSTLGVLEIASLTGRYDARAWRDPQANPRGLYVQDADNVAAELFNAIGCGRVLLVQLPLFREKASSPSNRKSARGRNKGLAANAFDHLPHHLRQYTEFADKPDEECSTELPTFALIGVGALAGRHRLCIQGEVPAHLRSDPVTVLKKAAHEFMVSLGRKAPAYYCPVADLTNYLRAVRPPGIDVDEPPLEPAWTNLLEAVEDFNAQVICVGDQLFQKMIKCHGFVMVVAGGPWKHYALQAVLEQAPTGGPSNPAVSSSPAISHLVTDAETARFLTNQLNSRS